MPFSRSAFTEEEKELMRRAKEARRLIRTEGLNPWVALWWVTAPDEEAEQVSELLEVKG
jgi:hypothetical protein